MAQHCGYCNALHVGNLRSETCTHCPTAETIPPADKWKMRSYSVRGADTFEKLKGKVQAAINDQSSNTKWLIFNFHKLCDEGDQKCLSYKYFTMRNDFVKLVQFLKQQVGLGAVSVQNVKDVMHDTLFPVPRSAEIPFDSDEFELGSLDASSASLFGVSVGFTLLALVGIILF